MCLEVREDEAMVSEQPDRVEGLEGRSARIIVMDDEESIRVACRKVLGGQGYEVDVAADGAEGWARLKVGDYDLALVDLKMPKRDGRAILDQMHREMPDVVAVVITGYASYETAVEAIKLGAYDYVPKPFTPDELQNVVRRGLERRFLRLANRRLQKQRKRDLLDLTEERSRLLTVVNSMADAVLVINSSGDIVLHNPSARRWVLEGNAVSQEEPVPLDRVPEAEPLAALVDEIQADPELKGRDLELEVGGARVLHASATRVADEEDRYLGTVVVLRDITGRKEIEHMKSAFVRMVAHELKSPLAAVEGYLDVICQADDAEDRTYMVSRCLGRVQSLQRTIADLLDLSRLESGQVQRELRRCDLVEIMDEVIEMQRVPALNRAIDVRLRIAGSSVVTADRRELNEIFSNILSNAIKYNRNGGRVEIDARCSGDWACVTVTDTGIGVEPEHVGELFEEFYRVRSKETAHIGGTGLGLSIVRALVDLYRGRVSVDSEPGKGTTVTVELPLAEADQAGRSS